MTIQIAQDARQTNMTHWRWSVWLDASAEELDRVEEVVWKLHPSFSPSEVRVDNRSTSFRLKSSGWGEFEIQAEVRLKNGEKVTLRHWLRFKQKAPRKGRSSAGEVEGGSSAAVAVGSRQPKVFLSYTSSDARLAGALVEELKRKHNIDVFVDVDIPIGQNLRDWASEKIRLSDAAVFLLPKEEFAPLSHSFTGYELGLAQQTGTPIIPILRSETDVPDQFRETKAIRISGSQPSELEAQSIARSITDIVR
ncbi:hypothetical protein V1294_002329 [Bradyrhizobium sp. AZCC 1678]|uniref:pYEATS domain-containing protein n=1 Tax=Bradyrhizobium sp. AZCC 1678 TaxID=3117030 RepID=UPI002FF0DB8A